MRDTFLGIVRAALIALVMLTGAIAVPILFRPFFYLHIKPFDLANAVGLTVEQVKAAYNEMMNFCIGLTDTFSVGALSFSQSGRQHFEDVQKLFLLDLRVLVGAGVLLIAVMVLQRKKTIRLWGHTPGFWGAVALGTAGVVIAALAALDFDRAFAVFHQVFFPGKNNWAFSSVQDPVINILPSEFFRNCAILILTIIFISSTFLLIYDIKSRPKE